MATTGGSLQPIYQRLNGTDTYHPLQARTFSDWSLEAGDVVTVTRGEDSYKSPVHNSKLEWRKGQQMTVTSDGNEKRKPIAKVSQKKYGSGGGALRGNDYQHIYVEDIYNQLKSGLELTTSTAWLYTQDAYNRLESGLRLTSSSAKLYVDDAYNRMKTGLNLTSSSASLAVNDAYNRLKTGLELTSSTAELYVDQAYNKLKAGLKATASSAKLYAESRTSKAEIIARINESGGSEALISADRISMSGNVTLSGAMKIDNGNLSINKKVIARNVEVINNIKIMDHLTLPNGLYLEGNGVWQVLLSKSGDTYTLKERKLNGTERTIGTFSRAITSWTVSGGSGRVRVTASPQNQHEDVYLKVQGAESISSNGDYTFRAYYEKEDGSYSDTGAKVTTHINVTPSKNNISASRGNWQSTDPAHDAVISNITVNGYYLITVNVSGVEKKYRLYVNVT